MGYKHGKRFSRAWTIWSSMKNRCMNPNNPAFANYGGRGITIPLEWHDFRGFYADMGDPADGLTLERVNNTKGYSKENCVWTDRTSQNRNKRNNIMITIHGETLTLAAWAERYRINYGTAHQRIRLGWDPHLAVTTPLMRRRSSKQAEAAQRGVKLDEPS